MHAERARRPVIALEAEPVRSTTADFHPNRSPQADATHIRIPGELLRVAYLLILGIDLVLITATLFWDLGFEMPRGTGQLDLRAEFRVSVWYSSALLLLNGGMALLVGFTRTKVKLHPVLYRSVWIGVASVFIYLSVDETLELHERVGRWFNSDVVAVPAMIEVYAWVLALLPLIALFVAVVVVLIRHVLVANRLSRRLATAALTCWLGVIVAETVEAQMMRLNIYRSIEGTIEEGLEIAGSSLFFVAFCEFLRRDDAEDT